MTMWLSLPDYFRLQGPARQAVWTWWLGFVLIIIGILGVGLFVIGPLYLFMPSEWLADVGDGSRGGFADYLILFLLFIPAFIIPLLIWRWLHALPFKRLITSRTKVRWGHLIRAMVVIFVGYLVVSLVDYQIDPEGYEDLQRQTDWHGYFILLMITLLLCPLQAASEEILLRGYGNHMILQTLERLHISPIVGIWIAYCLTSALFASLHLGNPESEGQVWPYMTGMLLYGLGMCVFVHFENGLESAIGYHIANNIFAFSILGYTDPTLPDSALLWVPEIIISWTDIVWEFGTMSILIAIIIWWNRQAEQRRPVAADFT